MNKEQEEKLNKAIDKLIGYHVGDKVIITNAFTGRTMFSDGRGEYSFDVESNENVGKIGEIEEIQENTIPKAYRLKVKDGYGYTYISDNFRLLE